MPSFALSPEVRALLERISRAAFTNPFGDERWQLDAEVAGLDPDDPEVVPTVIARLRSTLDALPSQRPKDFARADAQVVEDAILFDAFHRFAEPFDAQIAIELKSGETAPFEAADEISAWLARHGFRADRTKRALELFWQLRRAYHFIASGLVGRSRCTRSLREALWNAVFTHDVRRYERHLWDRLEDFSTMILGATGCGKGAAAAALGRSGFVPLNAKGNGFGMPFVAQHVPLNLAEVPATLLESALFGHERGAFTGAIASREGALGRCGAHATLFLDEIGEIAPHTQVKLLRVLQERTFSPVGSAVEKRFAGRVVAATHRSIDDLRREGRFRDDFYYRLCSHVVRVPTLQQRLREDASELQDLLGVLIERIVGERERSLEGLVEEAIARDLPADYGWPGNVRELEQTVRSVLLTGRCAPDPVAGARGAGPDAFGALADKNLSAAALLAGYCAELYAVHGTYEQVAQITGLDRRTVKKHVLAHPTEPG